MKLEEMKGLHKPLREKLRKAGIRSVEALATVDPQRRKVGGVTPAQLSRLKRAAQVTIFHSAYARVKQLTDEAIESAEGLLQEATWATVDAAKLAESRAREAVRAAQGKARVLARVAATKTGQATRSAEKEYGRLKRQIQRAPKQGRSSLQGYEVRAKRAVESARRASVTAKRALELANQRWRNELKWAQEAGIGLVHRLRRGVNGDDRGLR